MNIYHNYSLKNLTTIKIGGRVSHYVAVYSLSDLKNIINFAKKNKLPYFILGNGSNVLISDKDFRGVVIKLDGDFKLINIDKNKRILTVGAGTSLIKVGNELAKREYLGFSYMAVIPGTIGGAIRMNASIKRVGIKDNFLEALIFNPETNEIKKYTKKEMKFRHRKSAIFNSNKFILNATFKLTKRESYKGESQKLIEDLIKSRLIKQPKNTKNFGSIFKSKSEKPIGWYLDMVGMRSMRIGGAMVSKKHSNWIVNLDEAKYEDVKNLIQIAEKRVLKKFGIKLEREVIFLPEDMKKWK